MNIHKIRSQRQAMIMLTLQLFKMMATTIGINPGTRLLNCAKLMKLLFFDC
jgi:hypothetical protein